MQARCPHCQNIFPTARGGIQFCPSCGKQINVPLPPGMSPGGEPSPGAGESAGAPTDSWGQVTGSTPAWGTPADVGAGTGGAPPPPNPVDGSVRQPTPWELRKTPATYFQTWKGALGSDRFWSSVKPDGSAWDAFSFAWLTAVVSGVLSIPFTLLQRRGMDQDIGDALRDVPAQYRDAAEQIARTLLDSSPLLALASAVIAGPIAIIISAAMFHLALMLLNSARNGFTATLRAVCYAYAPLLLSFVPVIGIFLWLYWLGLSVWGASRTQQASTGHVIGAVALATTAFCCCLLPLFSVGISVLLTAVGMAGAR